MIETLVWIVVGTLLILMMIYAAATLIDFIWEEMKKGKKDEG